VRRVERTVTVLWAGIFLALFYANIYERQAPPFVPWDRWEVLEEEGGSGQVRPVAAHPSEGFVPKRYPAVERFSGAVGTDTVGSGWLQQTGHWPEWKALRLVELRGRWGGIDSALAEQEGWDREGWTWRWSPPAPLDLNSVSEEALFAHPLWRAGQVRAVQRFRSRVRPVRNWEEVFRLADFDSVQKIRLPRYFEINSRQE